MMTVEECCRYVEEHMTERYATANRAFKSGRTIVPKGCVNHSVGTAQPSADVFFNLMNKASAEWAVNAILGDFHKGDGVILVVMPLDQRSWGCGSGARGSWNDSRVQWEVCEPAGHTYAGGTMVNYDAQKNAGYFERMWKMLVAWNVYVAVKFGYSADAIADHSEACKAGYGSNHTDMSQWLPEHGKSMDDLREEVRLILIEKEDEEVRYQYLQDIPDNWDQHGNPRAMVEMLMNAGIVSGDGSDPDGNKDKIDFSHDMVRMLTFEFRGGLYDTEIRAAGFDPAKIR